MKWMLLSVAIALQMHGDLIAGERVESRIGSSEPPMLEALSVAYLELSKNIERKIGTSQVVTFGSNVKDYNAKITKEDSTFVVVFSLVPMNGVSFRGGGFVVVVDQKNMSVLSTATQR